METIRNNIIETLQELNKLINNDIGHEQRMKMLRQKEVLHAQLRDVLRFELDQQAAEYQQAIDSLQKATAKARDALEDIQEVAETIGKVASAIEKVDKVVSKVAPLV